MKIIFYAPSSVNSLPVLTRFLEEINTHMTMVNIIILIIKFTITLTYCIIVGMQFSIVEIIVLAAKYFEVCFSGLMPDAHEMDHQHSKTLAWGMYESGTAK